MKPHRLVWIATALAVGVAACSGRRTKHEYSSPHEFEPATEKDEISDLIRLVRVGYEDKYVEGSHAYRLTHAKSHGCVKAKFEIASNVPADLRKGIFADPGRSYETWVRFSNGASEIEWDSAPASRGMAIKILGVKGAKLLEDSENDEPESQDFLLHSFPSFGVRDVDAVSKLYQAQTDAAASTGQRVQDFWSMLKKPNENLIKEYKRILPPSALRARTLLTQSFWSGLAASVGDQAVKFKTEPCKGNEVGWHPSEGQDPDFLRLRLARRLENEDACFEFKAQRYVNDEKTPVENGTAIWPEDPAKGGSPYVTVARVILPSQEFDTYERKEFCDKLSFNPWHSLIEHLPLGGLNRLRRSVYLESARYRRQFNGTVSPNGPAPQAQ